jgi:hypothetical protein
MHAATPTADALGGAAPQHISASRRVAWRDWREWVEAAEALVTAHGTILAFSEGASASRDGARAAPPPTPLAAAAESLGARARIWAQRGHAPLAATTSLQLAALLLDDIRESVSGAPPTASPPPITSALALALVRFVNGVADAGQTRVHASSVAELARRAGLPRWLVDLRHDAAHGAPPAPAVTRIAARGALEWILARYWAPQLRALHAASVDAAAAAVPAAGEGAGAAAPRAAPPSPPSPPSPLAAVVDSLFA